MPFNELPPSWKLQLLLFFPNIHVQTALSNTLINIICSVSCLVEYIVRKQRLVHLKKKEKRKRKKETLLLSTFPLPSLTTGSSETGKLVCMHMTWLQANTWHQYNEFCFRIQTRRICSLLVFYYHFNISWEKLKALQQQTSLRCPSWVAGTVAHSSLFNHHLKFLSWVENTAGCGWLLLMTSFTFALSHLFSLLSRRATGKPTARQSVPLHIFMCICAVFHL